MRNGSLCLEMPAVINRARRRKVVRVRYEGMIKSYYDYVQEKFSRFEERKLRTYRERIDTP